MRAYKKSTQHPYCLYLKSDELVEVLNEIADAINRGYPAGDEYPALNKVHDRMNGLLREPS